VVTIAFFGLIGYFAQKGVRFGATDQNTPQARAAAAMVGGAAFAGMPLAFIVYAMLQAILMKWWLAGLRFGPLEVRTILRKRRIFGAYFRCIAYIVLVLVALSIVFGIVVAVGTAIVKAKPSPENMQNLMLAGVACVYLLLAICGWIIYQMTIKLRIWRVAVDSITVPGFDAIAQVRADDSLPSSAVGEGLADALGAGGI
jgi:hypothetical protein